MDAYAENSDTLRWSILGGYRIMVHIHQWCVLFNAWHLLAFLGFFVDIYLFLLDVCRVFFRYKGLRGEKNEKLAAAKKFCSDFFYVY